MSRAVFIAATGQNVGKTTVCLGLIAALRKRFPTVGFIKPVGQQHVKVSSSLKVDKDAVLFKEYFQLHSNYEEMSPIILPSGFTRDFLDGLIGEENIQAKILAAFQKISQTHAYTIVEGTGHIGVGSIVNMNNAQVAALLGLDVIMIASGGLGSAYDELILNIEMCQAHGVKVKGVILNRVLEEKRGMIQEYFPKALARLGIPLMGCIPYNKFLNTPALKDFEVLFKTSLIAGEKHHYCHFPRLRLVAGSLESYQAEMLVNELIITPASREDIILATIKGRRTTQKGAENDTMNGMILTGHQPPSPFILDEIKRADIPALYVPLCSYDAMKTITSFTAKILKEDIVKIKRAIELIEENVDLSYLTAMLQETVSWH